jgi:putative endonuclease
MGGVVVDTRAAGELGERIACAFLELKGYEVLERNFRYARREIDLVARDRGNIVAVEVKMRRGGRFGKAAQAINRRKIERIQLALAGLVRNSGSGLCPRVDVIAIDVSESRDRMIVEHYVGIF